MNTSTKAAIRWKYKHDKPSTAKRMAERHKRWLANGGKPSDAAKRHVERATVELGGDIPKRLIK